MYITVLVAVRAGSEMCDTVTDARPGALAARAREKKMVLDSVEERSFSAGAAGSEPYCTMMSDALDVTGRFLTVRRINVPPVTKIDLGTSLCTRIARGV